MVNWIITQFGQYEPLVDPSTGIPYEGLASVDFTYLAALFFFGMLLLYCLRIILAFFKGVAN